MSFGGSARVIDQDQKSERADSIIFDTYRMQDIARRPITLPSSMTTDKINLTKKKKPVGGFEDDDVHDTVAAEMFCRTQS